MRLFVAIELPDEVKTAAADAAEHLRAQLRAARLDPDARWVKPAGLHITLAFLGWKQDDEQRAIERALEPYFALSPFQLELGGIGAFPRSGPPRVFWLGARAGAGAAAALQDLVVARLTPTGFEPEQRPFSPHVTLARIKAARGPARDLRRLLDETPADAGAFAVTHVTLFRSHLSPSGSTYEALLRVPLQG